MASLLPPPGVVLMTVGDARERFPDRDVGRALPAWGDSPAVQPDPEDWWCWVLDDGLDIRSRFETRDAALMDAWRILWWALDSRDAPEVQRQLAEAKIRFLAEQGWGFPESYKEDWRKVLERQQRELHEDQYRGRSDRHTDVEAEETTTT